jgi:hypothetical protein
MDRVATAQQTLEVAGGVLASIHIWGCRSGNPDGREQRQSEPVALFKTKGKQT